MVSRYVCIQRAFSASLANHSDQGILEHSNATMLYSRALSGNKLSELLPNGFDGLPNLRIL